MKNGITLLSIALLALGLSTPVLADTYSPFDVTVPNQQGGISFGADALYMRGTAPDLGYGTAFTLPSTTSGVTTVSGSVLIVNPSYQLGFDATLEYRFPGIGNDVTLNWTHLGHFGDSDSSSAPFLTPREISGTSVQYGNAQFDYDAVDLDLGQRVNFGDNFQFRVFAGGRWAYIEENTDSLLSRNINTAVPVILSLELADSNQFKGAGPQMGFDGRYCLGRGFGIDANLTGSLIAGSVDEGSSVITTTTHTVAGAPVIISSSNSSESDNDRNRVVPALNGSAGLDYTYAFANCDRSYLTVQAGYEVISYFDATQNIFDRTISTDNFTVDTSPRTFGNGTNSIVFDGPYAGIKVNL